jgi:hypothetical protein
MRGDDGLTALALRLPHPDANRTMNAQRRRVRQNETKRDTSLPVRLDGYDVILMIRKGLRS